MLGQLRDAGNTTTLAHYLQLLDMAGLITGLQKYSAEKVRQRASSPKLIVLNTAFMTTALNKDFESVRKDPSLWGRLVESAVGATLINYARTHNKEVFYWAGNNREVDFVVRGKEGITAIEVKSGVKKVSLPGMEEFAGFYPSSRKLLIGAQGVPVERFLSETESVIPR